MATSSKLTVSSCASDLKNPLCRIRRRKPDGLNSGLGTGHERRAREVSVTDQKYFRRGFKMRGDVQHLLDRDYRSEVVDRVRENGNILEADGLLLRLRSEESSVSYPTPEARWVKLGVRNRT